MKFLVQRFGYLVAGAVLLGWMTGCASPGTPRPPSLHLPERVSGLSAERHGNTVVVRFITPQRSTDDEPLTAPVTASLCRAVGDGPCRLTTSFRGKITITGPVEWVDILPADLTTGVSRRLAYKVELFNPNGRSAGASGPAFAAGGPAPGVVDSLHAEGSHAGIMLRWTPESQVTGEVLVRREDLNAPARVAAPVKKVTAPSRTVGGRKSRGATAKMGAAHTQSTKDESTVWMHAEESDAGTAHDSGGMVDTSAHAEEPYRYTAVRSRTVTLDGRKLELRSEVSAPVSITLHDVFPPSAPQGLQVAGFPFEGKDELAADLVWQPDVESDLAGYNVYRQAAGGEVVKLTPKPVALPAFHDAAVARGVAYRYKVTAVDNKGNESAASVAAELAAAP